MGETNSPSVAYVGYDISPLSRVKLKILTIYGNKGMARFTCLIIETGLLRTISWNHLQCRSEIYNKLHSFAI